MTTQSIWKKFSPALHRFLRSQTACEADADDLLQEIFIKIHLKSRDLERPEALPAWIWQVARNALADHRRRKKGAVEPLEKAGAAPAPSSEENLNQFFAMAIEPLIELLPEAQREAIRLADFEKMSQKALAERWNLSHSGAKSRIQRARAELAERFEKLCDFSFDRHGNILDYSCPPRCS